MSTEREGTSGYRLYVTDGRGRIASVAREIRAASDGDALAQAVELVGAVPFEIWLGSRRVVTEGHGERSPHRPAG